MLAFAVCPTWPPELWCMQIYLLISALYKLFACLLDFPTYLLLSVLICFLTCLLLAFSALTLLVGQQEGHPACKKTEWWGAGVVICLDRGANLHTTQLMPLPLTVSRLVLSFWYRLTWVVPKKGHLTCVCYLFFDNRPILFSDWRSWKTTRQPNLPVVFLRSFWYGCSIFCAKPSDRLGRTSLKWPILCRVARRTSAASLSQAVLYCLC